jgi:hypothetical protein
MGFSRGTDDVRAHITTAFDTREGPSHQASNRGKNFLADFNRS